MDKCGHCPVAGLAVRCHAHATGHLRFCELARTRDDYRRLIYEQSTGQSPEPPRAPPPPPRATLVPLAVNLAVLNCPSRGAPIECGCAAERRYCGETLDLMVREGCVACKAAEADGA